MTRDEINREVKYYQIREFETSHPESHDGVVSEEELKRRCFEMCSTYYNTHCEFDWDRLKSILLHGEGEKGEEPCYVCKQVGNHEPWCSRGKPSTAPTDDWPGPEDIIKMRRGEKGEDAYLKGIMDKVPYDPKYSKPSTAPTRAEWEAWIQDMPYEVTIDSWENWQLDMQQWFRSMPIVPK